MIRYLRKGDGPALLAALGKSPLLTVRTSTLFLAYGVGWPFLDFWVQGDFSAVYARLEDVFFIYDGGGADYEELSLFLSMRPRFRAALGEARAIRTLSERLYAPNEYRLRSLLAFHGQSAQLPGPPIDRAPDLKAVYRIIQDSREGPGAFAPWYTDLNHRIRHGCARAYLITDGEPASACLVSAETAAVGLISGVMTSPSYRGRGYAAALVAAACGDLQRAGKTPLLECGDRMLPYYTRLGFVPSAETASLSLNTES